MAGVEFILGMDGVRPLMESLALFEAGDRREVLEIMGGVAESAVRRRLGEDKEGPDGEAWPDWSERYAATRHGNQSLLESSGALIDSVHSEVGSNEVRTGSPLVYAAIHHFGGEEVGMGIPARPWLGMSADDEAEMLGAVEAFVRGKMP